MKRGVDAMTGYFRGLILVFLVGILFPLNADAGGKERGAPSMTYSTLIIGVSGLDHAPSGRDAGVGRMTTKIEGLIWPQKLIIEVVPPSGKRVKKTVTLSPGINRVDFNVARPTGMLDLSFEPAGTEVYIGGRRFPTTTGGMALPPGEYEIVVRVPGYESLTRKARVVAGRTSTIHMPMHMSPIPVSGPSPRPEIPAAPLKPTKALTPATVEPEALPAARTTPGKTIEAVPETAEIVIPEVTKPEAPAVAEPATEEAIEAIPETAKIAAPEVVESEIFAVTEPAPGKAIEAVPEMAEIVAPVVAEPAPEEASVSVREVGEKPAAATPFQAFRDCDVCPEMVAVPAGEFLLGQGDTSGRLHQRRVVFSGPFSIGRFEITYAEWIACEKDGVCGSHVKKRPGPDADKYPVGNINFADAKRYVRWLSGKTGQSYRLPTEAEWEYVARAGTSSSFWWGDVPGQNHANCYGCDSRWDGRGPAPVGSFPSNPFGLFDTSGNVWEWVEDCFDATAYQTHQTYPDPVAGNAFCDRVLRGGGWDITPDGLRSIFRYSGDPQSRFGYYGFRVVRE
jgi:formylglycine-generating enzyme required for sulfatase activity